MPGELSAGLRRVILTSSAFFEDFVTKFTQAKAEANSTDKACHPLPHEDGFPGLDEKELKTE